MSKPIAGHPAPPIGGTKSDIIKVVKDLSDKVNQIPAAAVTDDEGNVVANFDEYTHNAARIIISATEPTGLNMSTDVGTMWVDTSTDPDTIKWWDGFQFWDYVDGQDWLGGVGLDALGPSMLANALTNVRMYRQATQPVSTGLHWFWSDSDNDIVRYYDGSTWVIVADATLANAVNIAFTQPGTDLTDSYIVVYYQNTAPGAQNTSTDRGNLWFDSTTATFAANRWNGTAWVSYVGDIRTPAPETDGVPPSLAPTVAARPGFGSYFVTWDKIANNDPVTYKVYMSTATPVTQTVGNYLGETDGTFFFTNETPAGAALVDNTSYYFAVVASDADGDGPISTTANPGAVRQKIVRTQITDAAIDTPQLNANAVTAGILASNSVYTSALQADSVGTTALAAGAITVKHTLTGPWIQTASGGERLVMRNDGTGGILETYSGFSGESPGAFNPSAIGSRPGITIYPSTSGTYWGAPQIQMYSGNEGSYAGYIGLSAYQVSLAAAVGSSINVNPTQVNIVSGTVSITGAPLNLSAGTGGTINMTGTVSSSGNFDAPHVQVTSFSMTAAIPNTVMDSAGNLQKSSIVSQGAVDSGGSGYRVLRVPN